ncbi:hypothetical protein KUTeg_010386 [Tegillarca granosa]|uniref:Major facilitator superfamily (MFS) profile domain-containing protein n=1 Tax=Tegillarca granosa TaxID=220873 RepID=A0ABQ9F6K4_TEGGR|nr:hypothetical protein KUTeg_010386 [Tegillarca granosa]
MLFFLLNLLVFKYTIRKKTIFSNILQSRFNNQTYHNKAIVKAFILTIDDDILKSKIANYIHIFLLFLIRFKYLPAEKCHIVFFQVISLSIGKDSNNNSTKWGLVCDKARITATITLIQMSSHFIIALIVGHISDIFGRRPTIYAAISFLTFINFIAYFSVSWQLFAILRFFIGFPSGNYIAVYSPPLFKFIHVEQKPILHALPSWTI